MSNIYNSIYRGIVIQNNDKQHAGMVKVFVPGVTHLDYNNFRYTDIKDKVIKYIGDGDPSGLTRDDLDQLRLYAPWATMGLPVTSEGSGYRYNYISNNMIKNSGSQILNNDLNTEEFYNTTNNESDTTKAGEIYEKEDYRLKDAFDGSIKNTIQYNPSTFNYKPSVYSAGARGEFGIPNVGAVVAVQFFDGDPQFPFITHIIYGKQDWNSLYDNTEYPGSFENNTIIEGKYNHNLDKYRSKYILNQKGGTIEINNTDDNEKVKVTHYSGSFKEFNNQTNIELAVNNDQKLVQGDKFSTVRGNQNVFIGKHSDKIVEGDDYEKVGNLNKIVFDLWKKEVRDIADVNQLFDIKRAADKEVIKDDEGNVLARFSSKLQTKMGTPADNPNIRNVLGFAENAVKAANKALDNVKNIIKENSISLPKVIIYVTIGETTKTIELPAIDPVGEALKKITIPPLPIPNLPDFSDEPLSPSSADGNYVIEEKKEAIQALYQNKIPKLIELEKRMGIGGSKIIQITKDKIETIGMTMNDYGAIRIDGVGKIKPACIKLGSESAYVESKESPLIEYVNVQPLPGGTYTLNVCDRFNVLVGAGGFDVKSYGSVNISGTITNIAGEQVNIASRNEINIESAKRIHISADILTLRQKNQKQVLVDSSLGVSRNVLIGGGLYVEGETYLQHVTAPLEYQYTNVDGGALAGAVATGNGKKLALETYTLAGVPSGGIGKPTPGVKLNTYEGVAGGVGVNDGYLIGFCNVQVDATDSYRGVCPVYITAPAGIEVYPHRHMFPNLPLTLKDDPNKVRADAKDKGDKAWASTGVSMGYKGNM